MIKSRSDPINSAKPQAGTPRILIFPVPGFAGLTDVPRDRNERHSRKGHWPLQIPGGKAMP